LKVERDDWKPLHQVLTNDGNRVGWTLWDYGIPGGVGSTHDFMTTMLFTDYAKIREANDAEAFRKAHPEGRFGRVGREDAPLARRRADRDLGGRGLAGTRASPASAQAVGRMWA
jgi:hypothetical protein